MSDDAAIAPVYEALAKRSATLLSDDDEESYAGGIQPWHLLLHAHEAARAILQSVAGTWWAECHRQIQLMPLRMREPTAEAAFAKRQNALTSWAPQLVWFALLFVLLQLSAAIRSQQWYESRLLFLCGGASAVILVLGSMCSGGERTYYIAVTAALTPLYIYGFVNLLAINGPGEIRALWFDMLSLPFEFAPVIYADAILHSSSGASALFHAGLWLAAAALRIAEAIIKHSAWPYVALHLSALLLLYALGWLTGWYRELRERCDVAIADLVKATSLAESANVCSRDSTSLAEEVVARLKSAGAAVADRGITPDTRLICDLLKEGESILSSAAERTTRTPGSTSDFEAVYRPRPNIRKSSVHFGAPISLRTFEIDQAPVQFASETTNPLESAVIEILQVYTDHLHAPPTAVARFAALLAENCTDDLPYHNTAHAAGTAQAMQILIRAMRLNAFAESLELLALTLASFSGDLGHAGRSDAHYIHTDSVLALATNDSHVLQSFQSVLIIRLLHRSELVKDMSSGSRLELRRLLVNLITATDRTDHTSLLAKIRLRRTQHLFDPLINRVDRILLGQLCLTAANHWHDAADWPQFCEWTYRYYAEIRLAAEADEAKDIPATGEVLKHIQVSATATVSLAVAVELSELEPNQEAADLLAKTQRNSIQWRRQEHADLLKRYQFMEDFWQLPDSTRPLQCLEALM